MEWHTVPRQRWADKTHQLKKVKVDEHPLQPVRVTSSDGIKSSTSSVVGAKNEERIKSKSVSTSWGGIDPLSAALKESNDFQTVTYSEPKSKPKPVSANFALNGYIEEDFEQWSTKKSAILTKYTTSEKLSLKTSFLVGGTNAGTNVSNVRNLQTSSVADKVKHRLQQLDDFEEGSVKEMLNLTQQDYINRIEELNNALSESWEQDQRVKALKIVIQCAKLLADVSVIQFYPSKFVLITEILDNFGSLVYQRIHCKAETSTAIESARETCRNWFYKVASIRELIPRLFVEAAILRTYRFIADERNVKAENIRACKRLLKSTRGIGDPLVAVYARAYLCRVVVDIIPEEKAILKQLLKEFFIMTKQMESSLVRNTLSNQNFSFSSYYTLYSPALDWVLQCTVYKSPDALLEEILNDFGMNTSISVATGIHALFLNSVLTTFRPAFITKKAKEFVDMVKITCVNDSPDRIFPRHHLLRNLGSCFFAGESSWIYVTEQQKLIILNEVWKMIARLRPSEYIMCAEVWMDFVVLHFGVKEINTLLRDIVKHMQPDRAFEDHYDQIISIISKTVRFSSSDFYAFFSMESFIPFLDMLQKESVKVEACKIIVEHFVRKFGATNEDENETTCDPVILNSLIYLCKTMHDSVSAITLDDEKRQISNLIIDFLRLVSFERDFEAHLNFMVEARATFSNLEAVVSYLVHSANQLAMETRSIVKGHHTKKTTAFVRTCLAYSYITIPSLDDVTVRLQLYLNSAQVALVNSCLSQTDAFLKAAIMLIPELPPWVELSDGKSKSTEPFLVSYVANLLSFLIVVPDNPEQEPLYLLCGLINVVTNYNFDPHSDGNVYVFLNILSFLSTATEEEYPYHVDRVDSNDTLYGNDARFMEKINELNIQVMEHILSHLKKLGEENLLKRQSSLATEIFLRLITFLDLTKMGKLAFNLLQLALKNASPSTKEKIAKCEKAQRLLRLRNSS